MDARSAKSEFIKVFGETARYHNRYEVFRDFVTCAAIAVHNGIAPSESLESEYLSIVKRYEKDDVNKFCKLLGCVMVGLHVPNDFLGAVFMGMELGNQHVGQFFTPYEVSRLMAGLVFGETLDVLNEKPFITCQEPTAGAGGMIVAMADVMLERNYNPQTQLWVQAIDIDPVASMMCFLQLSLMGIPAEIITGNTLSMKFTRVMRTPAHYIGGWDKMLVTLQEKVVEKQELVAANVSDIEIVMPKSGHVVKSSSAQLALFDFIG